MTGHNYPDHFYADALARDEKPLGAYRSTDPELSESERKLRTALAYVCHARDLINDALAIQRTALKGQTQPTRCDPERVPKWDPAWGKAPNCDGLSARDIRSPRDHDEFLDGTEGEWRDLRDYGSVFYRHEMKDGKLVVTHVPLETVYVANPSHPMSAEAIRDHDERLAGGEDRL